MFFRKKKHAAGLLPGAWVNVIVAFFIVAGIIHHVSKAHAPSANITDSVNHTADALKNTAIMDLTEYKNKIFPSYNSTLHLRDIKIGSGFPAFCSQQVSIAYSAFLENGTPVADKANAADPLIFRLGEGEVIPAFEQGVLGMKKGGTRSVFAPANLAYGIEKFARKDVARDAALRFEIELLEVSPTLPDRNSLFYRIADVRIGKGDELSCGDTAKIHVTLWSMDGKKLFSTQNDKGHALVIALGRSQVFTGLEQGIIGMRAGGLRTLIIPPALQQTLNEGDETIHFPLPKDQPVLVDVNAIQW